MSSRGNAGPVKIVFINTEYVQTDETSFKSIVQRLTGKDSKVGAVEQASRGSVAGKRTAEPGGVVERSGGRGGGAVMSTVVSFKDFDRLLMEMPPMDELYRLFAD